MTPQERRFDLERFGRNLKAAREERKLSLRDAALLAEVHFATFTRVERATSATVSLDTAAALASWAGLSLDDYVIRP